MSEIKGTVAAKGTMKGSLQAVLGKDGLSAYEVALVNGFEGTEAEWLASLKGERGEQGEQGIQGVRGERGLQGEKGEKGEQGEQGIQGVQGVQGIQGVKGDPFTYEDFTEAQLASLKVKGDKGDKGDTGNSGVYLGSGDMPEDCNVQIDPNGDFSLEIDQTYTPESENAQSGKAVAEAVSGKADVENWELIQDVTLTEAVVTLNLDVDCKKVYLEANLIVPEEGQSVSNYDVYFQPSYRNGGSSRLCLKTITTKNSTSVAVQAEASITPSNRITGMLSADRGEYGYFGTPITSALSTNTPKNGVMEMIRLQVPYAMQAGTTIKIWGVR